MTGGSDAQNHCHVLALLSLLAKPAIPADQTVVTDWLKDARIGAFMRFLPANATD